MRKIRDVLRLTFGEGLSRRPVSFPLGIPVTTVSAHGAVEGHPAPAGLELCPHRAAQAIGDAPAVMARVPRGPSRRQRLQPARLLYWVTGHVHAFEFFGSPEIVVGDNLRSGVNRSQRYEPDINATYQEMAAHYSMALIPTRPHKPRDKAKVEAGALLAEGHWVTNNHAVVVVGPTGVGKTYLACALAHSAIRHGHRSLSAGAAHVRRPGHRPGRWPAGPAHGQLGPGRGSIPIRLPTCSRSSRTGPCSAAPSSRPSCRCRCGTRPSLPRLWATPPLPTPCSTGFSRTPTASSSRASPCAAHRNLPGRELAKWPDIALPPETPPTAVRESTLKQVWAPPDGGTQTQMHIHKSLRIPRRTQGPDQLS